MIALPASRTRCILVYIRFKLKNWSDLPQNAHPDLTDLPVERPLPSPAHRSLGSLLNSVSIISIICAYETMMPNPLMNGEKLEIF